MVGDLSGWKHNSFLAASYVAHAISIVSNVSVSAYPYSCFIRRHLKFGWHTRHVTVFHPFKLLVTNNWLVRRITIREHNCAFSTSIFHFWKVWVGTNKARLRDIDSSLISPAFNHIPIHAFVCTPQVRDRDWVLFDPSKCHD